MALTIVTIEAVRAACRVDGAENDVVLDPIAQSAEAYIREAVSTELAVSSDARVVEAVLTRCSMRFRPDQPGIQHLEGHLNGLIKQINPSV